MKKTVFTTSLNCFGAGLEPSVQGPKPETQKPVRQTINGKLHSVVKGKYGTYTLTSKGIFLAAKNSGDITHFCKTPVLVESANKVQVKLYYKFILSKRVIEVVKPLSYFVSLENVKAIVTEENIDLNYRNLKQFQDFIISSVLN